MAVPGCSRVAGPKATKTGGRPWTREVLEEACASVEEATLLGFARGKCIRGEEEGLVLVRSLWRAEVTLLPWEPQHETTDRMVVPLDEALAHLKIPDDHRPIVQRWLDEALTTLH